MSTSSPYVNTKDLGKGARESLVPVGAVVAFAASTIPSGFMLCNGSVVARETYPDLFASIGTTFNTGGEAADSFRLPNIANLASNVRYAIKY